MVTDHDVLARTILLFQTDIDEIYEILILYFNSIATAFELLSHLSSSMPCQSKVSSALGPLCTNNINAAIKQYIVPLYPLVGL